MASRCSTRQSPRAAKAFSRAWAARTWPAPEEADSSRTRGLRLMPGGAAARSRRLPGAGRELLEDSAAELLELAEAREIFLKLLIEALGVGHRQLVPQNEVAQLHRVGQKRVLLQLLERGLRVVVVHGNSPGAEQKRLYPFG